MTLCAKGAQKREISCTWSRLAPLCHASHHLFDGGADALHAGANRGNLTVNLQRGVQRVAHSFHRQYDRYCTRRRDSLRVFIPFHDHHAATQNPPPVQDCSGRIRRAKRARR